MRETSVTSNDSGISSSSDSKYSKDATPKDIRDLNLYAPDNIELASLILSNNSEYGSEI